MRYRLQLKNLFRAGMLVLISGLMAGTAFAQSVSIDDWGFDRRNGWDFTIDSNGRLDLISPDGNSPSGWVSVRAKFADQTLEVGQRLLIAGKLHFVGGHATTGNLEGIRYGVFNDLGNIGALTDKQWTGNETVDGYLFLPLNEMVTWQGIAQQGNWGGKGDHAWISTNGANDYVLGSDYLVPWDEPAPAGVYDFYFSFNRTAAGLQIDYSFTNSVDGFSVQGSNLDTNEGMTTTLNNIGFAFGVSVGANEISISDVEIAKFGTTPAIADVVPQRPHAPGDLINFNGSFDQYTFPGHTSALGWYVQNASGSNAVFTIVNASQDGDNRSLQIDFNDFNGTSDTWNVEVVNEPMYVTAGESYDISLWAKADNNDRGAVMYMGLPSAGNWARLFEETVELFDEWTEYNFSFIATADAETHSTRFGISFNFEANDGGVFHVDNVRVTRSMPTSISEPSSLPNQFNLSQNYPNPFNPTTQISFEIPSASFVTIDVFNQLGQKVANLISQDVSAGVHTVNFDATNLASGIYIYQLRAGDFLQTKKMMLIK